MSTNWTRERIEALSPGEIRTLGKNARERGALEVAELCEEVFQSKFKAAVSRHRPPQREPSNQVTKAKAFEMRGVTLKNSRWSWGGIRPSDGMAVFTVWKHEIQETESGYEYVLWATNSDGSRPWSDSLGGRERQEHCKIAFAAGEGEGVLIYGEVPGRDLPAGTASKVTGADPFTVIRFKVEMRGDDYWAVWERKGTDHPT
jgi:hypothetical protein